MTPLGREGAMHDTTPVAPPAAALDSAEGCAGDDSPGSFPDTPDRGGLLCAATFVIALASAAVLQMSGHWSACMRWIEALFTGSPT